MYRQILTVDQFVQDKVKSLQIIEEQWNEIPSLNFVELDKLPNGSLIKFRGMVQDMHSPEYYFEKYEIENTRTKQKVFRSAKYQDFIDVKEDETFSFDNGNNVNQERQTFFVISVPGLNSWTHTIEKQNLKSTEVETETETCVRNKRKIEENENSIAGGSSDKKPCDKTNEQTSSSGQTAISAEFLLNFPLPNTTGKACLVKMYDDYAWIKINEMIEIVGFLSVDPLINSTGVSDDAGLDIETQVTHPPTSLIPRIHCVLTKKITHNNPLLPDAVTLNTQSFDHNCTDIYKDLHLVLTQLLLGDKLAAEFLILHLISRVYLRQDILSIGQFSMNISNIPSATYPEYGKLIYDILEMLLPKSYYFPMTLDNMNSLEFTPKKDYDCNRLNSGLLQLSAQTHLIVDESRLQTGKLDQLGVRNVQALANVIKNQRIDYDFKYYKMDFETDIPVLIFSEGKSLLPHDIQIPLNPDNECMNTLLEIVQASKHFLNADMLNKIRKYLTVTRYSSCELSENIQEVIQEDFVNLRKNSSINADDLHKLLVLARLISLSQGKSQVETDAWKRALSLEAERKSRLQT